MNQSTHAALTSHASDEWRTPAYIIDAAIRVMGTIDCDPASPYSDGPVPATIRYTKEDDGLSHPWNGTVFLNPPFGQVKQFVVKALTEFKSGRMTEGILITSGGFDTAWWSLLKSYTWCGHRGRIKFIPADGNQKNSSTRPNALFYLGNNGKLFFEVFSQFGPIYKEVPL